MQKEYKNMYLMMTKHSPFPSNCLPLSDKVKNSEKLKKILDISRSIASLVNNDVQQLNHKRRVSEYQIIDFKRNGEDRHASSRRIHHNYSHFITGQTARTAITGQVLNQQQQRSRQKYETLQEKANSTIIPRRKDLYDNHIEKYMATKYDNDEIIKKYLSNRQSFIQEACLEIEKDIKQDFPLKKSGERKKRRHRSRLPKIEEASSHMLQKTGHRNNDAVYQQEMNQIKKSEELEFKERRRQQRAFKNRMSSLEAKIIKFKSPK